MTHVAILLKVMIYIPVAELTFGGTPIANSSGLKITPPPSPRAPATHPPKNPRVNTFLRVFPSNTRSLYERLMFPYFFFSCCCLATNFTATNTMATITTMKRDRNTQSAVLHLLKPILPLPPLNRLWRRRRTNEMRLRPCLLHWPWLFSW